MTLANGDAHDLLLEAYGVRVAVSVGDPALLPDVMAVLPPGWTECADEDVAARFAIAPGRQGMFNLTRDENPVGQDAEREVALGMLDSRIRMVIAQGARDRTFIHAGVVEMKGRAVLLPGRSFAGKTTLVEALIREGATYFSDEYAVLDDAGLVHPYAKPLSIRPRDAVRTPVPSPGTTETTAAELGGVVGDAAVPIGLIASLSYVPGGAWSVKPLSRGEGALALLDNSVSVREQPEHALRLVTRAAATARAVEGERGEALDAARELMALTRES
jgi:hypothetical protein